MNGANSDSDPNSCGSDDRIREEEEGPAPSGDVCLFDDARCPICLDHPHNAVVLKCSSDRCRPFICNTSQRHSNCLDKFAQSSVPSPSTRTADDSTPSCPFCRGRIRGWFVNKKAREALNSKVRECSHANCEFSGSYEELRMHARNDHPSVRPWAVPPQQNSETVESQDDLGVFGVIEYLVDVEETVNTVVNPIVENTGHPVFDPMENQTEHSVSNPTVDSNAHPVLNGMMDSTVYSQYSASINIGTTMSLFSYWRAFHNAFGGVRVPSRSNTEVVAERRSNGEGNAEVASDVDYAQVVSDQYSSTEAPFGIPISMAYEEVNSSHSLYQLNATSPRRSIQTNIGMCSLSLSDEGTSVSHGSSHSQSESHNWPPRRRRSCSSRSVSSDRSTGYSPYGQSVSSPSSNNRSRSGTASASASASASR